MSDVEQAIRDLIEEQVSSVVETHVEDAVSSHTELQDLQYKVEDLESRLDGTNDDDTIDLVVGHIIKKLIGDNNKVVSKSYVDNLQNEIAQLKIKLEDK